MGLFQDFKSIIDNSTYQYITRKNIDENDLKTRQETIVAISQELNGLLDDQGACLTIKPYEFPYEVLHHLVNIPQVYSVIRYKPENSNRESILVVRNDHAMMMIGVENINNKIRAFTTVTMDHYVFRLSLIDKDPYFDGSNIQDLMKTAMLKQSVPIIDKNNTKKDSIDIATTIVGITERFALGYA